MIKPLIMITVKKNLPSIYKGMHASGMNKAGNGGGTRSPLPSGAMIGGGEGVIGTNLPPFPSSQWPFRYFHLCLPCLKLGFHQRNSNLTILGHQVGTKRGGGIRMVHPGKSSSRRRSNMKKKPAVLPTNQPRGRWGAVGVLF